MTDSSIDLTVVVTTHAEGRLLRPTLRSIGASIRTASTAGWRCELLLIADNADIRTQSEIARWGARQDLGYPVRILEVSLGESGAARNAGAAASAGEHVAFVDGDDLVSADYFGSVLEVLRGRTGPTIVHPDYVISFGARSVVWRADPTDHHEVTFRDLVRHNLWPSSAAARRDLYLDHPYRSLHPTSGYGPEDWVWNIDTTAAGATHLVARDSVFFYRVRERGGVNNRHALSILPWFDLDALRRALPASASNETEDHLNSPAARPLSHRLYSRMLPVARWSTRWLSFEAKHAIYRAARSVARGGVRAPRPAPVESTLADALATALADAAEIEPAITWTAYRALTIPVWHAHDDGYGAYLEAALNGIADRGDVLVLVPWLGVGGADLVSLNYARALAATERYRGRVTVLATSLAQRTRRELIPDDVNFVQLDERWLGLDPGIRSRLLAQLIILARPDLIVSVNCHHFTEAMPDYSRQILDGTRVFATLFAFDRVGAGYPTNPITDDSQRAYLDDIDGIITDNTTTARLVEDILALPHEQILIHRQPAMDDVPPLEETTAAYTDEQFDHAHPFRLVWPHRLDAEKRPDVLIELARELRRRDLPVVIDVWGQRVLTIEGDSLMTDLAEAGVTYRGPYSGGLPALPTREYHGLLLTSQSEGLPLVLVQSLLLGLPVVASGVGGVPDIIQDGVTGLLSSGPDDIDGFADAIRSLLSDAPRRRALIEAGHAFAARHHSWDAFEHTVATALLPQHLPADASSG